MQSNGIIPAGGSPWHQWRACFGVTRAALSRVLNGRAAISPEMALRLERWLGPQHGGRADEWLRMQTSYDLWVAEKTAKAMLKKVKPIESKRFAAA